MRRCLILSCAEKKDSSAGLLPAIERYKGPSFKVLHRFLSDVSGSDPRSAQLDIYVLSAKFGLISGQTLIPYYNQRMTRQRAATLHSTVIAELTVHIASEPYEELFLSMGQTYLQALRGFEAYLAPTTKVIISKGGSGSKLTDLKAWLIVEKKTSNPIQLALAIDTKNGQEYIPGTLRGCATIKGVTMALTPDEIHEIAQAALKLSQDNAFNYKNWYVQIGNTRISPKWLVQQLSGVPVSKFDASAARRFLTGLGIPIYRNQ